MGVLMGFNLSSILRIKHTFAGLSKKSSERLEALSRIQDPSNSFKNLREAVKKSGTASIPYLGLHLSDFTATDDGNPSTIIVDSVYLINFPKFKLLGDILFHLLGHQKMENIKISSKDPLYTFLEALPALSENELYQLSLEREPRGCDAKDVGKKPKKKKNRTITPKVIWL